LLLSLMLSWPAAALDNGLALTPPMGFRTWNQFGIDVDQSLMQAVYRAMVARTRAVDGKPTSLLDLGCVSNAMKLPLALRLPIAWLRTLLAVLLLPVISFFPRHHFVPNQCSHHRHNSGAAGCKVFAARL